MSETIDKIGADGDHVVDLLSAYIDNMLDKSERVRVREHLEVCADCKNDYVELRATQQLLQSLPEMPPPRAFTLTPEMVGATAQRAPGFWQRLFAPANAPRFAWGSGLAFTVAVFMFFGGFFLGQSNASNSAAISPLSAQFSQNDTSRNSSGSAAEMMPTAMATPHIDFAMSAPMETLTTTQTGSDVANSTTEIASQPGTAGMGGSIAASGAMPTAADAMEPAAPPAAGDVADKSPGTPTPLGVSAIPEITEGNEPQVEAGTASSPTTAQLDTSAAGYIYDQFAGEITPGTMAYDDQGSLKSVQGIVQPSNPSSGGGPSIWVIVMLSLAVLGTALAVGALVARRRA